MIAFVSLSINETAATNLASAGQETSANGPPWLWLGSSARPKPLTRLQCQSNYHRSHYRAILENKWGCQLGYQWFPLVEITRYVRASWCCKVPIDQIFANYLTFDSQLEVFSFFVFTQKVHDIINLVQLVKFSEWRAIEKALLKRLRKELFSHDICWWFFEDWLRLLKIVNQNSKLIFRPL